jgi:hypothetical protein
MTAEACRSRRFEGHRKMKIFIKFYFVLMVLFLSAFFAFQPALGGTEPPDTIIINNDGYQPDRKGPVHFSHAAHVDHYGVGCVECHHDYENGVNVWKAGDDVLACNECHESGAGDGGMLRLKMAYHENCRGCHKEEPSIESSVPYNRCNVCHEKK